MCHYTRLFSVLESFEILIPNRGSGQAVLRLCAAFKKSLDKKNTSHYGTPYLISFTKQYVRQIQNYKLNASNLFIFIFLNV